MTKSPGEDELLGNAVADAVARLAGHLLLVMLERRPLCPLRHQLLDPRVCTSYLRVKF